MELGTIAVRVDRKLHWNAGSARFESAPDADAHCATAGEPAAADDENVCQGIVATKDFLGDYLDFHVRVGEATLLAKAHPSLRTPTGHAIHLRMKAEKCVAIPTDMTAQRRAPS